MSENVVRLTVPRDVERRALMARKVSIADDVAEAIQQERERVTQLLVVAEQAQRLGIPFDMADAVNGGMVPDAAREFVLIVATKEQDD